MTVRRNFISRLALCALLPYMIFAFGAAFLHTHEFQGLIQSARLGQHNAVQDASAFSHVLNYDRSQENCPACEWTHSISSGPQITVDFSVASTVTPFKAKSAVKYHSNLRVHSSPRAPPTV